MTRLRVEIEGEADGIIKALATIAPLITLELDGDGLTLSSETLGADRIETAWLCASTNERLLRIGAAERRLFLAELLS